ncbi:tRNA dimethylallyltransferase [Tropilaelaps mercedesae]|uniref:tRNA dimethylallyltransferase n=1 Tax=Tropilaelaps mercedesae TaxID=418985 RepID=A0A1V9WZB3_9ACAR|nr:tRNA dimethylallyltransferase [Tropilaelaps mercedesae]
MMLGRALGVCIRRLILNCFPKRMFFSGVSPLVVVLGSTGVGKSQLAIEIAKKFDGEVISADSMQTSWSRSVVRWTSQLLRFSAIQVYKGLDIITNKVTTEEMCGVRHHMFDFLDPLKEFTVVDFRNRALPILEELRRCGKMAVVVGGTNYYIESLLWETLVTSYGDGPKRNEKLVTEENKSCFPGKSTESLYAYLQDIDPARAGMIHPNDRRKIERSLQVFKQEKTPQSKIFNDQRQRGGILGGPLRYKDVIMFWIQCQQDVLEARIDARVDRMMEQGLINELLNFHTDYNARRGTSGDYTQGIFQSIGFKEFHSYLIASTDERESKAGKKMFDHSLWLMKQVTKRYSKYQKKWINKRFLGEPDREVPPIYGLDATNLEEWNENVRDTAFKILDDLLAGREPRVKALEKIDVVRSREGIFTCDVCNVTCVGKISFNVHMTSKRHHLRMERSKKATCRSHAEKAQGKPLVEEPQGMPLVEEPPLDSSFVEKPCEKKKAKPRSPD